MDRMSWIGLRSEREFLTLRTRHPHVHYTSDIAYAAPEILFGGGDDMARETVRAVTVIPAAVGELRTSIYLAGSGVS